MRTVLFAALAVLCPGRAQPLSPPRAHSPLLDPGKPGVYLEYERSEMIATRPGAARGRMVYLRMFNNTPWRITTRIGNPRDPDVCYQVVTDDPCRTPFYPDMGNCGDFRGFHVIQPGRAASLAILPDHILKGRAIIADFSFEWEPQQRIRHQVWFGSSNLPPSVRPVVEAADGVPTPRNDCSSLPDLGAISPPPRLSPNPR